MGQDMNKWPYNPSSNIVDSRPNWRQVTNLKDLPVNKLRQVEPKYLKILIESNLFEKLDEETRDVIVAFSEGVSVEGHCDLIVPDVIASVSETANKNEIARSRVDVHALLQLAATAIATGDLSGTPVTAKEKIELMKLLINKALPDPKSIEHLEMANRVDKAKRKAEDMSESDLRRMSRDELLDLLK